MEAAIPLLSRLCAGMFCGFCVSTTLVVRPSFRRSLALTDQVKYWEAFFPLANSRMAPISVLGGLLSLAVHRQRSAAAADDGAASFPTWSPALGAGLILLATVAYSIAVMGPVNKALLLGPEALGPQKAEATLRTWDALQTVRTVLSVAAFALTLM
eukprot:gnl/Hemi2/24188_TR8114_c0_g1_i1.p1 gnl/Hemi2/24188_TR8114_c0_g1~~gnl/Hemi2/24188_TR8114_c0_g1_i1.p1  ORF type:complete len:156 (-),score=40.15 gnl/Hemi2/24188_TR8114_c0_g1_i1:105-572(-)